MGGEGEVSRARRHDGNSRPPGSVPRTRAGDAEDEADSAAGIRVAFDTFTLHPRPDAPMFANRGVGWPVAGNFFDATTYSASSRHGRAQRAPTRHSHSCATGQLAFTVLKGQSPSTTHHRRTCCSVIPWPNRHTATHPPTAWATRTCSTRRTSRPEPRFPTSTSWFPPAVSTTPGPGGRPAVERRREVRAPNQDSWWLLTRAQVVLSSADMTCLTRLRDHREHDVQAHQ
jgi:hypothetical protein